MRVIMYKCSRLLEDEKIIVRKVALMLLASIAVLALSMSCLSGTESQNAQEHTQWIANSLKEMETIKVGMTRADLLRVFTEEGGLSTRTWQRYVFRECPYIKVDVEFEPMGNIEDKLTKSQKDEIIKISKPFLEWSVSD